MSSCSVCEAPPKWPAFIPLIHQTRVRAYKGRIPLSGCPGHTWITLFATDTHFFPGLPLASVKGASCSILAFSLGFKVFSVCSLHVDSEGNRCLSCFRAEELAVDRGSVLCNLVQSCRHTESFQPFLLVLLYVFSNWLIILSKGRQKKLRIHIWSLNRGLNTTAQ